MGYQTLIDAGPIIAYYQPSDSRHKLTCKFFEEFTGRFVTTCPVITEVMWMLGDAVYAKNELLKDLARKLYSTVILTTEDFLRIAELNLKYRTLKLDFADLSLVAIAERLDIGEIASFDGDFDIYRRIRHQKFQRVFP